MSKKVKIAATVFYIIVLLAMLSVSAYAIFDGISHDTIMLKKAIVWIVAAIFFTAVVGVGIYENLFGKKESDDKDEFPDIFATKNCKAILSRFISSTLIIIGLQIVVDWTDDNISHLWKYVVNGMALTALIMLLLYIKHIFSKRGK